VGGKNQLNSSLPASLSGYLDSKNIPINYIIGDGYRTKVGTYESLNSQ
tara:strand:- start:494 stop:637 length:144 start_codon:yes stop_codon:yes gene_type:complete